MDILKTTGAPITVRYSDVEYKFYRLTVRDFSEIGEILKLRKRAEIASRSDIMVGQKEEQIMNMRISIHDILMFILYDSVGSTLGLFYSLKHSIPDLDINQLYEMPFVADMYKILQEICGIDLEPVTPEDVKKNKKSLIGWFSGLISRISSLAKSGKTSL